MSLEQGIPKISTPWLHLGACLFLEYLACSLGVALHLPTQHWFVVCTNLLGIASTLTTNASSPNSLLPSIFMHIIYKNVSIFLGVTSSQIYSVWTRRVANLHLIPIYEGVQSNQLNNYWELYKCVFMFDFISTFSLHTWHMLIYAYVFHTHNSSMIQSKFYNAASSTS
jgi:hypothetical protein